MNIFKIKDTLEDLGQEVSNLIEFGSGSVNWRALEKFSGEAIDAGNFLDSMVGGLGKHFQAHFDFFINLQASDAWTHMTPAQRRHAHSIMERISTFTQFFSEDVPNEDRTGA
jgi:hypothetical protein